MIAEHGTHEELMEKGGDYCRMFTTQHGSILQEGKTMRFNGLKSHLRRRSSAFWIIGAVLLGNCADGHAGLADVLLESLVLKWIIETR